MTGIIVGLYDDVALAQNAVDALVASGIPPRDISMLSNETIAAIPGAAEGSGEPGPLGDADVSGADLVPRLTRLGVPQDAAEGYAEAVRRGGALVVVRVEDARLRRRQRSWIVKEPSTTRPRRRLAGRGLDRLRPRGGTFYAGRSRCRTAAVARAGRSAA
jgi:hypothetical protein